MMITRLNGVRRMLLGAVGAALLGAAPVAAEPAMWTVKDKDSTIYLFGTVHLLRKDLVWETPAVRKAVADSRELWLEIADADDPKAMAPLVQKYALDPTRPLSGKLTAPQNAKLAEVAGKYGLQPAQLEPMKPWFVAMTLSLLPLQKAGYDAAAGVDNRLKVRASGEGDRIRAFETAEQQLGFLDSLPQDVQVEFLMQTLEEADEGVALLDKLAAAWARGDVNTVADELVDDMKREAPALYERLLTSRNKDWAGQIQTMLAGSGTHFIAVGAAHLVGPDSVQVQLAQRGIEATRD